MPRPSLSLPSLPRPSAPTPPSLWSERAQRIGAAVAVLIVAAIGFGIGYLVFDDPSQGSEGAPSPTAVVIAGAPRPDGPDADASAAGFPAIATRNTTRFGGADAVADAAGVALASYPSQGGIDGPQAAILAPSVSWQDALAATPLTAEPIASPLLLGGADEVPELTAQALTALAPTGLEKAKGEQLIAIGDVALPPDLKALPIRGADPAEIADQVDVQRAALSGQEDPKQLLVASSEAPGYAMPAAAWAARSGDPVLFAAGDDVPDGTLAVIKRHPDAPVYVLGPESVISDKAIATLEKNAADVTRVGSEGPVENAITFARYSDGDFGFDINDPGHGFTIASTTRPLDAAAAAPLAAGGAPGPLLVTDDAETIPAPLKNFLVNTQPGFIDDPVRAVYNHVWLMGDTAAISVGFQAEVDELTKLVPVSDATTVPDFGGAGTVPPPDGSTAPPGTSTTTPDGSTTTPDGSIPGSDGAAPPPAGTGGSGGGQPGK